MTIRIGLEPECLAEERRRRGTSLDRAEVLAAHQPQAPIGSRLVIEDLWLIFVDDSVDDGRPQVHESQLHRSFIFFEAGILERDESVRRQIIGIAVDARDPPEGSPQPPELVAIAVAVAVAVAIVVMERELGGGGDGIVLYTSASHHRETDDYRDNREL